MAYYVYILANQYNGTLYTGVTNDLERRMLEHKNMAGAAFTRKYKVGKLVYYQEFSQIEDAIHAEKQVKGWTRAKKIALIVKDNPDWKDLFFLFPER